MGLKNFLTKSFFKGSFKLSDTVNSPGDIPAGFPGAPYSGRFVSPDQALRLSTVFACVRQISETVGTLPCQVYRRERGGGKTLAPDHRLYALVHDTPNADMTASDFFEVVCVHLCLWGNHFSEIYRDGTGQVTAIYPLDPRLVDVGRLTDGRLRYLYADPYGGGLREISENDMFHVRGFGPDSVVGLSPISCARLSLDIARSAEEVAGSTYRNGMRPSGVISTDKVLSKEQRDIVRGIYSDYAAGPENAGGLLPLEAGFKYQQLGMNPADAQMLENRAFSVEDICRWFKVPPYMVGHTEKSTSWGSGLEQQNTGFATYTLRPYLRRIEQKGQVKLLTPAERGEYFIEFNLDALLRADAQARAALWSSALQNGWMTRNEVRSKDNLPPVNGGDVLTVQANMVPLDRLGQERGNGTTDEKPGL